MVRTVRLALVPGLEECGAVVAANDRSVIIAIDENLTPTEQHEYARMLLTEQEYNALHWG